MMLFNNCAICIMFHNAHAKARAWKTYILSFDNNIKKKNKEEKKKIMTKHKPLNDNDMLGTI